MKPVKDILIIDDEPVILDAVTRSCAAEGYTIDDASDAETALHRLNVSAYRLILCDIMMPNLDGFGFLAELNRRQLKTPVIMTTGYSTVENAVHALSDGAIDFLPKPFTVDELLAAVTRGIRYATLHDKLNQAGTNDLVYVPCPPKYFRLGVGSWVSMDTDGSALVGVTDLFIKMIESPQQITLSAAGESLHQSNPCAYVTSARDALSHSILCPMSGKIVLVNEHLRSDISLIEKDPFFKGWLYRIIPSHVDHEMPNLVSCSSDRM